MAALQPDTPLPAYHLGMKVLFLTRSLGYGGAERQLVSLAAGLHRTGTQVSVAVFYGGGKFERFLHDAGVPVTDLRKKNRWDIVAFFSRLLRLIRDEAPDIIHSYLTVANILAVIVKPFFPGIRIVWGIRASNMSPAAYDRIMGLAFQTERWLSRFPDLIIANSRAGVKVCKRQGYPQGKMVVIKNGIDTDYFRIERSLGKKVRDELKIPADIILIGLIGRLDPMKDHETFLLAARRMVNERDDIFFICAGDGPESYRSHIAELAASLNLGQRFVISPGREDMPSVYNALDILCCSSQWGEGFPNSIAEAMACGVCCVSTDTGDAGLIMGNYGLVIPPGDPLSLHNAWKNILDGRFSPAPGEIREQITRNYSLQNLIFETDATLRKVMT